MDNPLIPSDSVDTYQLITKEEVKQSLQLQNIYLETIKNSSVPQILKKFQQFKCPILYFGLHQILLSYRDHSKQERIPIRKILPI